MANILITSVQPGSDDGVTTIVESHDAIFRSIAQRCNSHSLVSDPEEADVILLYASFTLFRSHIDPTRRSLRRHPLRLGHLNKTFVYDIDDDPAPTMPGVFASLSTKGYNPHRQRAGPYIHHLGNPLLEPRGDVLDARHLFSFVGAPTHPLRRSLLQLQHAGAQLIPTAANWPSPGQQRDAFKRSYADAIHNSKFVLCPRGRGTSSVRLFEVMQAGRTPVIVSDDWVSPDGPDWDRCSVRVAEGQISRIPALLEQLEPDAPAMCTAARRTWETWFSEGRVFDRMIDWCIDLQAARGGSEYWDRLRMVPHFFRTSVLRRLLAGVLR